MIITTIYSVSPLEEPRRKRGSFVFNTHCSSSGELELSDLEEPRRLSSWRLSASALTSSRPFDSECRAGRARERMVYAVFAAAFSFAGSRSSIAAVSRSAVRAWSARYAERFFLRSSSRSSMVALTVPTA